jgi:predicted nucleotidyltransferase
MTYLERQLRLLAHAGVDFIVIGGMAAAAHGSARSTLDLDVVYARDAANVRRLVGALAPYHPYLRGVPPGLPFVFDEVTIVHGLNFTLTTDVGDFDLFGEVLGGGNYGELLPQTIEIEAFGVRCRYVTLDALLRLKRAAGRPKDLEAIAELELLRDRLEG